MSDELRAAAEALVRAHLDNAEVHPCDYANDDIRALQCSREVQRLRAALAATTQASPEAVATPILPHDRAKELLGIARTALAQAERLANGDREGSSHPHRDHIDTISVIVHALATRPANERRETASTEPVARYLGDGEIELLKAVPVEAYLYTHPYVQSELDVAAAEAKRLHAGLRRETAEPVDVRAFEVWLNDRRDWNVAEAFHDIVAKYREVARLAATPPKEAMP